MLEAFDFASQGHTAGLIPPGSTTFDLLLAVHIAAALTCVATAAIPALSPKHPCRWWSPPPPGWPPCAGPRTPTCWSWAPCRLPPPSLVARPGVDGGDGSAG